MIGGADHGGRDRPPFEGSFVRSIPWQGADRALRTRDARWIARLLRLGWSRPVHAKALPAQEGLCPAAGFRP